MSISSTQIGTANPAAAIYTSSGSTAITTVFFCNTHSTALVVQLYAIASGGGNAAVGNQIVKDLSIPAGDTYIFDVERLLLDNGDTLNANTTVASKVTTTVSQTSI